MNLIDKSVEVILKNQDSQGAYIACPNFSQYQFGWFRDGAYIAYAMDLFGYHFSSQRFLDWSSKVILKYAEKINYLIKNPLRILTSADEIALHCRFTLDGEEVMDGWSHHQLDGLGIWLWVLVQHCKGKNNHVIPSVWIEAANLIKEYITALWSFPCADCWEENANRVHTYTLSALAGGLMAFGDFVGDPRSEKTARKIMHHINDQCLSEEGFYLKSSGLEKVDANLLGLYYPFRILELDNPNFVRTLKKVELKLLVENGGLKRYQLDTYYGGGEWILLTAWLGCVYCDLGRSEDACQIRTWIEAQADLLGYLPEQVTKNVSSPQQLDLWVKKWGKPAVPLLWSHSSYLLLCYHLKKNGWMVCDETPGLV